MDVLSPHATHECGCNGRLGFGAGAAYAVPEKFWGLLECPQWWMHVPWGMHHRCCL